ncbi:MAG: cbb3-type cytochrome c oxidase N-terminal domain-containing protein [Ginsengibacter sp.]
MPGKHLLLKKIALFFLALLIVSVSIAQETAAPAQQAAGSDYNLLEVLLMIMALVFAFIIWGLGRVLLVLGKQLVQKNKKAIAPLTVLLVTGLLFVSQLTYGQASNAATVVPAAPNYGGLSSTTFYLIAGVVAMEVIIILVLAFFIKTIYVELVPQKQVVHIKSTRLADWWAKLNKKLTRAVPVTREADIMLDHNYDGIRELDNALPPWWKWGFIITIGIAVVYLLNFEVLGYGKNPTEEYNTEMANAAIQKEIYEANNKDKIDENNVPVADASGLAVAKEIFTTKCFACHGKSGEGGAGPNLTDDYWLHKGSLNDIYSSIKKGYPDKGMQSWASVYTPKEISFLASYVKTLHNTKPENAKPPQGDLYVDSSTVALPVNTNKTITAGTSATITADSSKSASQ